MTYCTQCGKGNPSDARFCSACGHRLEAASGDPASNAEERTAGSLAKLLQPDLWLAMWREKTRVPRLQYLLLAAILLLSLSWLNMISANFAGLAGNVVTQLRDDLEKFDVVNVAGTVLKVGRNHLWDCDSCRMVPCDRGPFSGACSVRCAVGDVVCRKSCEEAEAKRQCPLGFKQECGQCHGFNLLRILNLPTVVLLRSSTQLWSNLSWSGFAIAAVSAFLGMALVALVLDGTRTLSESYLGYFVIVLLGLPAGFVVAFLLKWSLLILVMILPKGPALFVWFLSVGKLVLSVFKTAQWLQKTVEGEPPDKRVKSTKA